MPQPFNTAILTDGGANLLIRVQTEKIKIEFTRIVIGSGSYSDSERARENLKSLTDLKEPKNSYLLSDMEKISATKIKLTALISNKDIITGKSLINEGYYINEIGLYAKASDDEGSDILYSIAVTAGDVGDFIPAYTNSYDLAQIIQDYYVTVDACENVTIHASNNKAVVLAEDFENHKNDNTVHIENYERLKWNATLQDAKDYANEVYQQSTGYTDRVVADLIGGAPELRNTLKELSDAIDENEDMAEALNAAIGKKADSAVMESLLGEKLDKTGDSGDTTAIYTSNDTTTPSGWKNFALFTGLEKVKDFFAKVSTMASNLRYLYKMLGTTDISSIGGGTVTGAIHSLNSNFARVLQPIAVTGWGTTVTFKMRESTHALVLIDNSNLILLWNNSGNLDVGYIFGGSDVPCTRSGSSPHTITVTFPINATITVWGSPV